MSVVVSKFDLFVGDEGGFPFEIVSVIDDDVDVDDVGGWILVGYFKIPKKK